jgi:hypothetical protein
MTHRKTREPDDSAERECETEQIEMTTVYRVEFPSPYDGRLRSLPCETHEEARRKVTKLLDRGYHEEDIVEVIRFTNG